MTRRRSSLGYPPAARGRTTAIRLHSARRRPTLSEPPVEPSDTEPRRRAPAIGLLLAGAATGLGLAAFGLLDRGDGRTALPDGAVARVGGHLIRTVDYERVLAGVESDRRGPVDADMRRRVLERMIDEELLVQRAIDLDLARIDRRVRGELTSSLIDSVVNESNAEEPSDREVERHYEENIEFFSRPGRIRAQSLYFSSVSSAHASANVRPAGTRPVGEGTGRERERADASERARRALEALRAGEDVGAVRDRLADSQIATLPDALLPASKIRDYLGPRLLEVVESLAVGVWSEPIESDGGIHLVRVLEHEPAIVPPLEEIEGLVRQDLKRQRGDEALRRYLDELRSEIPVTVTGSAL